MRSLGLGFFGLVFMLLRVKVIFCYASIILIELSVAATSLLLD